VVAVSNRALSHVTVLRAVAVAAAAVSLAATGAFALALLRVRPWIYGEAEVLYEASRIRDHLALYVDPAAGAFDYGPVPTRCTIVYPPLWSWVLSHVPAPATSTAARATCTLAWFGSLGWMAAQARDGRRSAAWLAATVVGGIFVLALFATSGRPDAIATAIAGVALSRAARRGTVGPLEGALLALAAWIKPNVLGIAAGLGVFAVMQGARPAMALSAGALALTVPIAATLQRVSGGTWGQHLLASLGQPLSLDVWWTQVGTRSMFLAPAILTTWTAARDPSPGARAALCAWVASLAWALVSLAKAGSASNYWMEPAIAAVAVYANTSPLALTIAGRTRFWLAAAVASVWLAAASVGGVLDAFVKEPRRAALLARARADCGARDAEVVLADNPGGELALNGRVIAPVFQMIFLVRSGRLPVATWVADVSRPEVACVLEEGDGAFHAVPEVQRALDLRMVEVERIENENWRLYARRDRPRSLNTPGSP
jgi:hypothetical protein